MAVFPVRCNVKNITAICKATFKGCFFLWVIIVHWVTISEDVKKLLISYVLVIINDFTKSVITLFFLIYHDIIITMFTLLSGCTQYIITVHWLDSIERKKISILIGKWVHHTCINSGEVQADNWSPTVSKHYHYPRMETKPNHAML